MNKPRHTVCDNNGQQTHTPFCHLWKILLSYVQQKWGLQYMNELQLFNLPLSEKMVQKHHFTKRL